MNTFNGKIAVVALGGNAITRETEEGNIYQQFANTRRSLIGVIQLIRRGYKVVITHGNGPQVGNALIRVEASRHLVPPVPLGVLVADLEGGMGYMIEQSLQNKCKRRNIDREVVIIPTQIIVDKNDPSILNPTKFVGPFYEEAEIERLRAERNYVIKPDPGRGFRRVVSSPQPLEIVEKKVIKLLVEMGVIVIAAGGGGIPVCVEKDGTFEGVDGVIDKDLAAAILGRDVGAHELYILTGVDQVAINFKKPNQQFLNEMTLDLAQKYLAEGQFPAGSMGPKIQASINFLQFGGEKVVISSNDRMVDALDGKTGTTIVR